MADMTLEALFDRLENDVKAEAYAKEGDYHKDGFLYCGVCHQPRQEYREVDGRQRLWRALCQCEKKAAAEKKAEEERENHRKFVRELRREAFADWKMSDWTFDRDDRANERFSHMAHNYAERFDEFYERGKGLLLYGDVGTGKTFMAACIVNAVLEQGRSCHMTNFTHIANKISGKNSDRESVLSDLDRYSLLIIDDLGVERDSPYMNEMVWSIIDMRYRSHAPLIVTTNMTGEELKDASDISRRRIYSRLFEMCVPFEVTGEDRRRQKMREDYQEMMNLLGLGEK